MKGIYNIGNSCYLNSVIQMLFNCEDFKTISKGTIFEDIINNYNSNSIFNPTEIKSIVAKNNKLFANTNQQDSFEFMIYLFDILDKILKNKLVYSKFGIETKVNIKCKMINCLKESNNISTELFLQLPMTDDLSDSYRKYKMMEILENENAYKCDNCNKKSVARRKTITTKWPDNLIIVLKRFNYTMEKDNRQINIPLEWRHGYKLKGGIIHLGQYGGGHYIYYGEENGKWYLANDTNITLINNINDYTKNSYILYFKLTGI